MNSYSIGQLYEFTPNVGSGASSRPNPLTDEAALNEAEFIDMRLSPQRSRVGVIFDIRWCDFGDSNTALVVLTGVGKLAWANGGNRQRPWHATRGYWTPKTSEWSVPVAPGGPMLAQDAGNNAAALTAMPVADKLPEFILGFDWLTISGLSAQMYVGHVEQLDGAPPDMGEASDAVLIAGFPQWASVIAVREHYVYPE